MILRQGGAAERPESPAVGLGGRDQPAFGANVDFAKLGPDARSALAASVMVRNFEPNDFVYLQDDEADYFYFVRSGHIRLSYLMEDGSAILYGILPVGESFGELGVFEGGGHCDTATAIGDVTVGRIPANTFRSLGTRYPEINAAVGRIIARRYRSYLALSRMLSLKTLAARLAQALLRLADGLGTRTRFSGREVAYVGAMVTQTDLGLMARGSRGNVNRALKAWERSGWIAIQDRCVLILNRAELEGLSLKDGL